MYRMAVRDRRAVSLDIGDAVDHYLFDFVRRRAQRSPDSDEHLIVVDFLITEIAPRTRAVGDDETRCRAAASRRTSRATHRLSLLPQQAEVGNPHGQRDKDECCQDEFDRRGALVRLLRWAQVHRCAQRIPQVHLGLIDMAPTALD